MSIRMGRRRGAVAFASAMLWCAGAAWGQSAPVSPPIESQEIGAPVSVTLKTGETLKGTFAGVAEDKVMINHPVLGKIAVPRAEMAGWASAAAPVPQGGTQPTPAQPAPTAPTPPAEPAKPAPPPTPPPPSSFLEGWKGSIELGLNGTEGNKSRFNLRGGLNADRKTEETETKFGFVYTYATEESKNTENKARVDLRNDWLLGKESPWRVYALGSGEYDEFQAWDFRATAFAGIGYQFIKTEKTSLIGRFGAGISREFGSEDNRIHPELDLGVDFEHKFTDRQKFTFTFDYYPDLLKFTDFRMVGKAAYEILLDPDSGLSLKLGVEDRYDATPQGAKRNDLDYFAMLVLKF